MVVKRNPVGVLLVVLSLTAIMLVSCRGQDTPAATSSSAVDLGAQTQNVPVGGGSYTDVSTDVFIPFDEVEANQDLLPADKGARIVIYCRSGSMSAQAARTLVELGYTDVWNLDGGMIAWQNSGRPLLNQ